jgi:hypothetical protein
LLHQRFGLGSQFPIASFQIEACVLSIKSEARS